MPPCSSRDAARPGLSRRAALRLLLGTLSLALTGCGSHRPRTHTVNMVSDGGHERFLPALLRVTPGDTVRWVLRSGFHSATAYHPDVAGKPHIAPPGAPAWDSGLLRADGAQYARCFEREGVHAYYCTPHEALGMVGLVVAGSPPSVMSASELPDTLPRAARERLATLLERARSG